MRLALRIHNSVISTSMRGKVLLFLVLITLGAVLPYVLADGRWLADAEAWLANTRARLARDASTTEARPAANFAEPEITKPTAANFPEPRTIFGTVPAGLSSGVRDPMAATAAPVEVEPPGRNLDLPRIIGPPGIPLENLLSFNVTPEWISANWHRVTTQLAELDLRGWRVPIAMGSGAQTLAGSATYYFDARRQLQRILLHGYASDPSEVIKLATSRFQMQRVPSSADDIYTATADGELVGGMRIRFAPIAKSSESRRCEILMELNRRGTSYGMSREFSRLLKKSAADLKLLDAQPR